MIELQIEFGAHKTNVKVICMSNLEGLVRNFQNNLNDYKNVRYNETETRREFIDPFFRLLGWDMDNSKALNPRLREVMPENYLSSTSRPDYAFTLSGVKKFFVEAKKPSVNILTNTESIFQARSYGWSAGHLIVILTNFEYILIYDSTIPPSPSDSPNTALLKKYNYSEYLQKFDEIKGLISRETVYSGNFEKAFENQIKQGANLSVDAYFLKQINNWRLQLANFLYNTNSKYSLELINDLTQVFINQMVFLRICEDRNLPLYHNLQQTLTDINELKNELNLVFQEADRKYNSGLFNGDYIIFDVSNEIIMDMIESLYYPQSPYVFNVIESNLLGQIYEMFLCERLVLTDDSIILSKKDENVNRDIVNTPIEIVRYMVEKALEPLTRNKRPDEILSLRLADISCGSGVFLLEMFDYILQYCIHWYLVNNRDYLIACENGLYNLPFEDKRKLILSCIYGVDIDPNAVEIAKFSLLIKLLENETIPSLGEKNSLLPNLDQNIKAGNSLVDFSDINFTKLSISLREKIFPFNWNFANDTNSFDAILGNPPYVTIEDMLNLLPKEEVEVYKRYQSAYEQFDKYYLFVERGIAKLKQGGFLCYIIPNKFSKIKSGENLRELMSDYKYINEFIDFGSAHLFQNKLAYSSILVIKKCSQDTFDFEEVNDLQKWWASQEQSVIKTNRVTFNSNILTKHQWVLVADEKKAELVNKLYENTVPLEKVAKAINGIQTSAERPNPIYWFCNSDIIDETETHFKIKRNENEFLIEKSILRPYFKPVKKDEKSVTTYDVINTNKWIIFPYDQEGRIYPEDIMKINYPNTWHYLNNYYDILLPKKFSASGKGRDLPHATIDTWYHYGRIQHLKSFNNTPKLIVRVMRNIERPLYYYDENDWLIAAGGTAGNCAIIEKEESKYKLEFIQAVLNHPVMGWLCSIIGSDFGGDFFSNGTYILNKLPIKVIDFNNEKQNKKYIKIINSTRRIYQINKDLRNGQLTNRQKTLYEDEKRLLIRVIKDIITELYDIQEYMQIVD